MGSNPKKDTAQADSCFLQESDSKKFLEHALMLETRYT